VDRPSPGHQRGPVDSIHAGSEGSPPSGLAIDISVGHLPSDQWEVCCEPCKPDKHRPDQLRPDSPKHRQSQTSALHSVGCRQGMLLGPHGRVATPMRRLAASGCSIFYGMQQACGRMGVTRTASTYPQVPSYKGRRRRSSGRRSSSRSLPRILARFWQGGSGSWGKEKGRGRGVAGIDRAVARW
jgi:hypothetical protein